MNRNYHLALNFSLFSLKFKRIIHAVQNTGENSQINVTMKYRILKVMTKDTP